MIYFYMILFVVACIFASVVSLKNIENSDNKAGLISIANFVQTFSLLQLDTIIYDSERSLVIVFSLIGISVSLSLMITGIGIKEREFGIKPIIVGVILFLVSVLGYFFLRIY